MEELVTEARAAGYELRERTWRGRPAWQWVGSGPTPIFLDHGEAIRWMQDYLPRRLFV